jgi:hypothetical protein
MTSPAKVCIEPGCGKTKLRFPSRVDRRCLEHRRIVHRETERRRRLAPVAHALQLERYRRQRSEGKKIASDRRYATSPKGRLVRARDGERRRTTRLGVALVIRLNDDLCGVCLAPLTVEAWPSPLATTIGHEPPLSIVRREGWTVVVERPEHLICNQRKSGRLDAELGVAS